MKPACTLGVVLLIFLLLPAFSAAQSNESSSIEKQLNVFQKIQDYNLALAESTLRNVSFLIAFLGGVLSFLSPCAVALFPAFLAYSVKNNRNATLTTAYFFAGFSLAFVAIGVALTSLGKLSFVTFQQDASLLVRLAGFIIIFLGILMLFGKGFSFIRLTSRLPNDAFGTIVFGALFAVGWSACIGPIIAGIFTMAAVLHNFAYTALLLFFYALGLAVPLFIAAIFFDRFNLSESRLVRGFNLTISIGSKKLSLASANILSGMLLVFLGIFFIANGGTTAITAADLTGTLFLLFALALVVVLVHKLAVARFVKSSNGRKLAVIAEIAAALAAFGLISTHYDANTVGIAEQLSRYVLKNTGIFSIIAAILLVLFIIGVAYFVMKRKA